MKKLLLLIFLLLPIKSLASGWEAKAYVIPARTDWILVIDEDEKWKEIKRWGFWQYFSPEYIVSYVSSYDDDGEPVYQYKAVSYETYLSVKECGYYIGG